MSTLSSHGSTLDPDDIARWNGNNWVAITGVCVESCGELELESTELADFDGRTLPEPELVELRAMVDDVAPSSYVFNLYACTLLFTHRN